MKPLFVPILDNGGGAVRSSFMLAFCAAMGGRNLHLKQFSGSLPNRTRNVASAEFLESGCDEMLMIDADIVFTKEHIDMLLEHDLPLVYGMYPKRQLELMMCLCTLPDHTPDPSAILVEVRRAASGFVRIKRELLESMKQENGGFAKPYYNHGKTEWDFWEVGVFNKPLGVHDGEFLSEDWSFCEHARAMGVPIMVDQRIQTRHEGFIQFPLSREVSW